MSRAFVLGWLTVLLAAACESESPEQLTEVVVQIFADEQVQQAGDMLYVELMSGPSTDALSDKEPVMFDLNDAAFRWPASIALVATRSHESHVFELNLRLEKAGETVARGRVQSGFVRGQTVVLQTSLDAECLGKLDCPPNETCVVEDGRATCQTAAVDAGALPGPDKVPPSNDAGTAPVDAGSHTDTGPEDASQPDTGPCSADAIEDCYNGGDDDCDGQVDCADDDCTEVTQCVPNALSYVLVPESEDCPLGYEYLDLVHQELNDPGCESCACQVEPKQCSAYVWIYDTAPTCENDGRMSGGTMLKDPASTECTLPVGKEIELPGTSYGGFRVRVVAGKDICSAGEAKPQAPIWNVTHKRCSAELRRGGCRFGSYCAVKTPQLCWSPSGDTCANAELAQSFYQGYDDQRTCQCACEIKEKGECDDVGATMTTDTTCRVTGKVLREGEKSCDPVPSNAVARRTGKPRDASCISNATQQGTVSPAQPLNLCCLP